MVVEIDEDHKLKHPSQRAEVRVQRAGKRRLAVQGAERRKLAKDDVGSARNGAAAAADVILRTTGPSLSQSRERTSSIEPENGTCAA